MRLPLLALVLLAACTPPAPMAQPEPVTLASPLASVVVIQRASQALVLDGFTIAVSDAQNGVLSATLQRSGKGDWGPLVRCNIGPDAVGRVDATMVLSARVSAIPKDGGGSSVVIASGAVVMYGPNSFLARVGSMAPSNLTDAKTCASSGETEQHIAATVTK